MDATEHGPHGHGVAAEPDVVSTKLVVGFAIILTIMAVVAGAIVAALFWHLDRVAQRRDAAIVVESGLQRQEAVVPPVPRLQVHAVRHWADFQTAERERLESYGWMDRSTGAVHIPIERAMELIAERGVGPLPQAPVALPPSVLRPGTPGAPPAAAATTPRPEGGKK
ncbi:MAG: hypothetical protein ACM3NW_03100 [Syntrophomonadaceae bacterium]